jgi:short-subunit dehydrogenase
MEFVLITGVTSSIGESIALDLSNKFSIVLSGRSSENLINLKNRLKGDNHLIWECDLIENNITSSLENFLKNHKIKLSHFLHLGGEFSISPIRLQTKSNIFNSFQINVFSAIEIISVLSKLEHRKNLKNILFFSSISTKKGYSGYSVYSSAKSSLTGLTKSLAIELKPTKINCLVLGPIQTSRTLSFIQNNIDNINNIIPLGIANSDVLTQWVSFFLQKNNWMTGQEIIIDGGATI